MKKIFIQLLLLFSSAISAFAGQWQAPGAELLPGSQVFPYPISQARWLWFQAKEIKGSATAYYRLTLDLEDDVKDAWFYLIMDDKGKIKVNGKTPRYSYPPQSSSFQIKIPRYNLSKDLKIIKSNKRYQELLNLKNKLLCKTA